MSMGVGREERRASGRCEPEASDVFLLFSLLASMPRADWVLPGREDLEPWSEMWFAEKIVSRSCLLIRLYTLCGLAHRSDGMTTASHQGSGSGRFQTWTVMRTTDR